MRDSVKMAVTLLIIAAICGGLLSVVNSVTGPIIEARAMDEFMEQMGQFFPDAEDFDVEEVNDEEYYICYDAAGEMLGVVGMVKASGYGGTINYNLAVDAEGDIIGISIASHEETPGIGDVIEKENFQNDIISLNFADTIALGVDVDNISGSTVTVGGMVRSVRRVMDVIGETFLGLEIEEVEIDPSAVADGTYTGTGRGFKSDITVEVTVSGGEITDVVIVEHDDTPAYFDQAAAEMPDRIIEAQGLEVDAVSEATMSSEGILEAVFDALN